MKSTDLGAWAFRIDYPNGISVHRTYYRKGVTNNQEELQAAINALAFLTNSGLTKLKAPLVTVVTDSQYIHNSITKGWVKKWQNKKFKDVKNAHQWKELLSLILCIKQIQFKWTKAHSDGKTYYSKGNIFVDHLLNKCMDNYIKKQKDSKQKED